MQDIYFCILPFLACWNFKYICYLLIFANFLLCFLVSRFYLVLTIVFPFLEQEYNCFPPLRVFSVTTVLFVTMSNFYFHSPLWSVLWMIFWLFLPVCKHCYAACVFIFHQVCADIFYSLLSIFVLHCFNANLICDCFLKFFTHFWVIFYFCVTVLHVILLIVFISDLIFMYNQSFTFIWLILFWHFVQIIWHFVQISNIWHCVHIYLINVIFGTVSRFVLALWPFFGYFSICFLRLISFFLHQKWCVICLSMVYPHPHVLRGV